MSSIDTLLDALYHEMVDIRRYLHENPELSFQEVKTPKFIAEYHASLGHRVREGVGGRGVVALLEGRKQGPTVALRADFDALPIHEENEVDYKSKVPGVMHACGHDGHTATLLVLAKAFNRMKHELAGNIVFIHQHAEELAPGGAIAMIEDQCLEGVDVVFGTHLWATEPTGAILYREGPFMAAADKFEVRIQGQGGHGAQPHLTKDAVLIGSQIVSALQTIVSRRVDPLAPAVVTVGTFEAGNAFNVIADRAKLTGTVRTFNDEIRVRIEEELGGLVRGVGEAHGAKIDFRYERGYPPVVNHPRETELIAKLAAKVPEVKEVKESPMQMGGEDFAYYLERTPGAFFFTGAKHPDWAVAYPHHHPRFNIDERAMLVAAKTLGRAALHYLLEEELNPHQDTPSFNKPLRS